MFLKWADIFFPNEELAMVIKNCMENGILLSAICSHLWIEFWRKVDIFTWCMICRLHMRQEGCSRGEGQNFRSRKMILKKNPAIARWHGCISMLWSGIEWEGTAFLRLPVDSQWTTAATGHVTFMINGLHNGSCELDVRSISLQWALRYGDYVI